MSKHHYRITVQPLAETTAAPTPGVDPLAFEVSSHDDLLAIVERAKARGDLDPTSATAFAVGLKLFSEVMLHNRELPLFKDFAPHFRDFMQTLKRGPVVASASNLKS